MGERKNTKNFGNSSNNNTYSPGPQPTIPDTLATTHNTKMILSGSNYHAPQLATIKFVSPSDH